MNIKQTQLTDAEKRTRDFNATAQLQIYEERNQRGIAVTDSGKVPRFKYYVGQSVRRFDTRVQIVSRGRNHFGTKNVYEISEYFMGNRATTSAWEDELSI